MANVFSALGIKIAIVCNGVNLHEYTDDDEEPQTNVISKYIEAVSGAEFGIHCELTSPSPPCSVLLEYHFDQKWVCGRVFSASCFRRPSYIYVEEGPTSTTNGQTYLHKFAFAALTIDDSAAIPAMKRLKRDIEGMGEITVKAYFVRSFSQQPAANRALNSTLKTVGKIPEKALKGSSLSHQTSLCAGQPIASGPVLMSICEFIDPAKKPFAIYKFKYRSRDSLKSLLVIPRTTPSPVPLEERDVDTLSAEELRELLRRQRDRDAAARAIKQERGIKRERTERSHTLHDDDDDEPGVGSTKRRRETYRTTVNGDGVEVLDFT